jgi:hypothetical protein
MTELYMLINPKQTTKKTPKTPIRTKELSKVAGLKVNIQKSNVFPHFGNN